MRATHIMIFHLSSIDSSVLHFFFFFWFFYTCMVIKINMNSGFCFKCSKECLHSGFLSWEEVYVANMLNVDA